jgi:hypothetical protein
MAGTLSKHGPVHKKTIHLFTLHLPGGNAWVDLMQQKDGTVCSAQRLPLHADPPL